MKRFRAFDQRKRRVWRVMGIIFLVGTIVIASRLAWIYGRFYWTLFITEEIIWFGLLWFLTYWLLSPIEEEEEEYALRARPWWDQYGVDLEMAKATKRERDPSFRQRFVQQNWREIVENKEKIREEVRSRLGGTEKRNFLRSLPGGDEIIAYYLEPLNQLLEAMEYQAQGGAHKDRLRREEEVAEIIELRQELGLYKKMFGSEQEE